MSHFLQVLIDPMEYLSLQNRLFASFTNIKVELLYIAIGILFIAFIYGFRMMSKLDVMSLGRENAINLGVNYDRMVMNVLILSSVFNCDINSTSWSDYIFRFNCGQSCLINF